MALCFGFPIFKNGTSSEELSHGVLWTCLWDGLEKTSVFYRSVETLSSVLHWVPQLLKLLLQGIQYLFILI